MKKMGKLFGEGMSFTVGSKPDNSSFTEQEQLVPVTSVAEAQLNLPFAIRDPSGLGTPTFMAATPRDKALSGDAAFMARYDLGGGSSLVVLQQGGDVVSIREGIPATVTVSPTGSMVRWIENGVSFSVIGQRVDGQKVLEAAEKL